MQNFLYKKKKIDKLSIRLAKINDVRFIFNLHTQNVLKKNFFSKKVTSFNDHKLWFKNKIKEKMLFICTYKSKVGYIRYDKLNKNSLTVSIAIKDKFKKKGFGRIMLKKTLRKKKMIKKKIYAKVKYNNLSSKKFFLNNGFKLINKNIYIFNKL